MATQCKLLTNTPQLIKPLTWTTLLFDEVTRDDDGMFHGKPGVLAAPSSGLIHPARDADFIWARFVQWNSVAASGLAEPPQFMEQFCRNPYDKKNWNSTASTDGPDTSGKEFRLATWPFRGKRGVSVGLRVWHDHAEAVNVVHAQFSATTWDY